MNSDSFKDYALDQLAGLPGLECRGMFGGFGLYAGGKFFGIIFQGRLYFKTSVATRASYQSRGMNHFRPSAKQQLTSYFEVPTDVTEDTNDLTRWAEEAIQIVDT